MLSVTALIRTCALATLLGLSAAPTHAQEILEANATGFRLDATNAQVDLVYGILQRALPFVKSGGSYQAALTGRAEIWRDHKVVATRDINEQVKYTCSQAELDSMSANKLMGLARFTIPYGEPVDAVFIFNEVRPGGKIVQDTLVSTVRLPNSDASKFEISGIELSSSATKADGATSPFIRAGVIMNPNPSGIYGENYTKLYYYAELYVPKASIDPAQTVDIVTQIVDPSGKVMLSSTSKENLLGEAIPLVEALDIDGLPEDKYKVRVAVQQEGATVATTETSLYYVSGMKLSEETPSQSGTVNEDALFATSPFSAMSGAELEDRVAQSMYLASESDRQAFKGLKDPVAKQHFLYAFWRKQDARLHSAHPLDAYNAFLERVAYVDKNFSYQKTIGWKSGRGRVYIVYGPPNYTKGEQFNPDSKPYIVWEYDPIPDVRVQDGAHPQFVFVDRQGGGNYFLVHSNVVGETSNPNWYSTEAHRLAH